MSTGASPSSFVFNTNFIRLLGKTPLRLSKKEPKTATTVYNAGLIIIFIDQLFISE